MVAMAKVVVPGYGGEMVERSDEGNAFSLSNLRLY
jgi:hypothetical protein